MPCLPRTLPQLMFKQYITIYRSSKSYRTGYTYQQSIYGASSPDIPIAPQKLGWIRLSVPCT